MTRLTLIEDGDPVGWVDTETQEAEYNGEEADIEYLMEELDETGLHSGPPAENPDGPNQAVTGDDLEEYIQNLAEMSQFEVES